MKRYDVHFSQQGRIYTVGWTSSQSDCPTWNHSDFFFEDTLSGTGAFERDIIISHYTEDGVPIWGSYYGGTSGGSQGDTGWDEGYGIATYDEGLLYITGQSFSDFPHVCPATTDPFCFPDPNSNEEAVIVQFQMGYVGIASTESKGVNRLVMYPNPAGDRVVLELPGIHGNWQVRILNSLGQFVGHEVARHQRHTVDLTALPPGLYHVCATADGVTYVGGLSHE